MVQELLARAQTLEWSPGLGVRSDRALEQSAHKLKHLGFRKDGVVSDSQFVVCALTRKSPYVLCLCASSGDRPRGYNAEPLNFAISGPLSKLYSPSQNLNRSSNRWPQSAVSLSSTRVFNATSSFCGFFFDGEFCSLP